MRSRCWGGVFDEPIEQPVEKPETLTTPPSTEDLLTIKIEDKIMAVVGTNAWNAIAYGNGKYVAVGDGGYVTTSVDGVNWTTPQTPINDDINTVSYCDGIFIAGGFNCCYYSADGIDWNIAYTGYEHFTIEGIAYHAGRIVAVGAIMENSYSRLAILTSNDKGISWTRTYTSTITDTFTGITHANGKYHVISYRYGYYTTSSDGINWDTPYRILGTGASTYQAGKIAGDQNGNYVIVSASLGNAYKLWYFSEGDSIATMVLYPFGETNETGDEFNPYDVYDIIHAKGTFIVVGYGYRYNYGMTLKSRGFVSTSRDGRTWSKPTIITNELGNEVDKALRGIVALP